MERIVPSFGNSFTINKFDNPVQESTPIWHFHEEIELVFIKDKNGKRHIGNNISHYYNGDLLLIGSKLPHQGYYDRFSGASAEIIIHFKQDFLGEGFLQAVEMASIKRMLDLSSRGLSFTGNTKTEVGERMESMFYMSHFEKMIEFLKVLQIMASARDVETLNAIGIQVETSTQGISRLDDVYAHVREKFQESIVLEDISARINMTVPSFCRFFKKHTGKTFIEFLNEYRITHACKLLTDSDLSITEICYDCGFNNFSHFNKYFKRIVGKSPSQFRKDMALVVIP